MLKSALSKSFAMKDLGPVNKIHEMHITRDISQKLIWLSQEKIFREVLERFNIHEAKSVSTPLGGHFKLSIKQIP